MSPVKEVDEDDFESEEAEPKTKTKKTKKSQKSKEESEEIEKSEKEEKKDKKADKLDKIAKLKITVNFWRTSLHGAKIGLRQKDQQMAKSRQFSKDMELYGEVTFGKEEAGNIGFKTTNWLENDFSEGMLPRLIVRYFNETGRWVGSIEENTILGLGLSTLYDEDIPVFNIFINGNPNVYQLQKLEKSAGSDECVVPIILDKKNKVVEFLVFDRRMLTMGDDWKVYLASNKDRTIADLDSKKLDIGGKTEINVYDPELTDNKTFITLLILFTSLIKFWDDVKKSLSDAYKKYKKGEFEFQPSRYELELMENPRGFRK